MGLIVGVNSYMTLDECNALVHELLPSFDSGRKFWDSLEHDEDKEAIILNAMSKIDTDEIPYKGDKLHVDLPLQFPRMYYGALIECPDDIKKAIVLQAIRDFKDCDNEIEQMKEAGVHSFSDGGGASITFESGKTVKTGIGIFTDLWVVYIKKHVDLIRPL